MSKLFVQVDRVEDLIHMTGDYFTPPKQKPKQKPKPITNADRIRSMSDEELAQWLLSQGCKAHNTDEWCKKQRNCQACWLEWLKQECDDNGT